MKDKRLLPCPMCGRHAEFEQPVKGVWNVGCGDGLNDSCGLVLFGDSRFSKTEMVARWNSDRQEPTDKHENTT